MTGAYHAWLLVRSDARTRYDLTNVGAEIRRVKERIAALEGGER